MKLLKNVLLFALPASGKSEVRTYLDSMSSEQCMEEFKMGKTLQLDDYPYVHFMHRIDDELYERGFDYVFFKGPQRPFIDNFEWGTLIHLLNEDYDNLMNQRTFNPESAANYLFDRMDNAHEKVGLPRYLEEVPYGVRMDIAAKMENEIREHLDELNATNSQGLEGKTVVIEAARGAVNGSPFPVTPPQGYAYAFSQLDERILDGASILYIWVTPEESRKKNQERAKPDAQGSILHHCVPSEVMLGEYGCDDMDYLISLSDKPNTVKYERPVLISNETGNAKYEMKTWYLPVGKFDNRDDKTTFIRKGKDNWEADEVSKLHNELKSAFNKLAAE
ncbi:MAG: hypothetical protein ABIA04_13935 [Pseudomonadota bacterium]